MKITIKNLGPIHQFDFDLRDDFVLIVGENNIGKSYAISVVYLLLKAFASVRRPVFYLDADDFPLSEEYKNWLKDFEAQVQNAAVFDEVDVTDHVVRHFESLVEQSLLPTISASFDGTFTDVENLQNRLTSDPLEITVENDDIEVVLCVDGGKLRVKRADFRGHTFSVRRVKVGRTVRDTVKHSIVYFPAEDAQQFESNFNSLLFRLLFRLTNGASRAISELHYLPASRSGLYQALSAFSQIVAELARNRNYLTRKIELPGIAEPLSDYFLKLSDVRPLAKSEGEPAFPRIAEEIEREILRGIVEFDSKTRRLIFKPENVDLQLDLSATSSMVSEISPIASYLKYVLPRYEQVSKRRYPSQRGIKQVLIIEEPEAHLHPEVQVLLIKVFAKMVRETNTKVIMTSHSNYVFNEVSNLIMSGQIARETFRGVLFRRGVHGSDTHELNVTRLGIEDENFVDVAEALYEEKMKMIKELNTGRDARSNSQ